MARQTPSDRLGKLLTAAAEAFVAHGFRRTQMDDIAAQLGVSKGTIYRHVKSKEALFAAVITHADDPDQLIGLDHLDVVDLPQLLAQVRSELATAVGGLALATAAGRTAKGTMPVEEVALDLYQTLSRHRVAIMVLDRCASEIDPSWYQAGRYALVDLWADYLRQHQRLRADVDIEVLARTIVEVITLWAVKMPWDPAPRPTQADGPTVAQLVQNLVTGAQP